MPEYKEDGTPVTVTEMASPPTNNMTFADYDAAEDKVNPYAVEGNDLSNFKGVSEEYRTYSSEVDSPLDFDASVADNSDEKLEALGVDTASEESTVVSGGAAESSADRNDAAQTEKESVQQASVEREKTEVPPQETTGGDSKPATPFPTA